MSLPHKKGETRQPGSILLKWSLTPPPESRNWPQPIAKIISFGATKADVEQSEGTNMSLPDSYTLKPTAIPAYFDAILDAQPPERFSMKFLENLGFTSTNDRLFIGILKDLGFLTADGVPQQRYFDFMDRSRARSVLAQGIREAFSDLFAVNTKANELSAEDVTNKLRTLYAGKKTDGVIERIARTFAGLCEYADFSSPTVPAENKTGNQPADKKLEEQPKKKEEQEHRKDRGVQTLGTAISLDSLQYHINIVLPESRDQAVYDAIFRSLREHLGTQHG